MAGALEKLVQFLDSEKSVVYIVLKRVQGSSPRDVGTEMFVSKRAFHGTIGGGQLEYLVIERAQAMLRDGTLNTEMDIPLGPEIGQCCGGRVEISLARMRDSDIKCAINRAYKQNNSMPHVYVMGSGHVGRALAAQLQHLPVRCILVDTRPEEIALCDANVEKRISAIPEIDIMGAPAGSAFIILTHDHSLDFLLTSSALERNDACYVGMIGSVSKRAKFTNWTQNNTNPVSLDHLKCPIGMSTSNDKRPSIIASFVVAEVVNELTHGAKKSISEEENTVLQQYSQHDRKAILV